MDTTWLEKLLRRYGLVDCSDCRSWYFDTAYARNFHYRRCGS